MHNGDERDNPQTFIGAVVLALFAAGCFAIEIRTQRETLFFQAHKWRDRVDRAMTIKEIRAFVDVAGAAAEFAKVMVSELKPDQ